MKYKDLLVIRLGVGLSLLCGSCAMSESEKMASRMDLINEQVNAMVSDKSCSETTECRAVELGEKPCGGPVEYVIYSVTSVDEAQLLKKVREYNELSRKQNSLTGAVSTCMLRLPPEVECYAGSCREIR